MLTFIILEAGNGVGLVCAAGAVVCRRHQQVDTSQRDVTEKHSTYQQHRQQVRRDVIRSVIYNYISRALTSSLTLVEPKVDRTVYDALLSHRLDDDTKYP